MDPMKQMLPMFMMQMGQKGQYERTREAQLADRAQAERDKIAAEGRLEDRNISAAERAATQEGMVYRRGQKDDTRDALSALGWSELSPDQGFEAYERTMLQEQGPPGAEGYGPEFGTPDQWAATPGERLEAATTAMSALPSEELALGDPATADIAEQFHLGPLTERMGPTYPQEIPYRALGSPPAEIETYPGQQLRNAQELAIAQAAQKNAQDLSMAKAQAFATAVGGAPVQAALGDRSAANQARINAQSAARAQAGTPPDWTMINLGEGLGGNELADAWRVVDATTGHVYDYPAGFSGRVALTGFASDVPAIDGAGNAPFVAYGAGTQGTGPVEQAILDEFGNLKPSTPAKPALAIDEDGNVLMGTPQAAMPQDQLNPGSGASIPGMPGSFTEVLDRLEFQNLLGTWFRDPTRHRGLHPVPPPLRGRSRFAPR
jgi:hypothetical protein